MKLVGFVGMVLVLLAAAVVGAGQFGLLAGPAPAQLGVVNGRLQPPSTNPNSVSSQASLYAGHPQQSYAAIAPLRFTGDADAAMARLANLLQGYKGTVVVARGADYIYAQCSTPMLGFTDDVEFWLDKPAGVIQIRSASRLGRKDFGVNRTRMEDIRAKFQG